MDYRTILVQLDVGFPLEPRLKFATELAERFEADLIAFAAAEVRFAMSDENVGISPEDLLHKRTEEIGKRLMMMREEYLGIVGESERFDWRGDIGNPTQLLALNARAADLIVTGMRDGRAADHHVTIDPGSLILSAGRPVLFGADELQPVQAKRIMVAWKDTREARRAVTEALPFLTAAEEVVVTTIVEDDHEAADNSAADVVRFLMRHGATARADVLGTGTDEVEDAISRLAHAIGADLIVSGGYGHSRIREWVWGGVTRSLLADGSLHRLISN